MKLIKHATTKSIRKQVQPEVKLISSCSFNANENINARVMNEYLIALLDLFTFRFQYLHVRSRTLGRKKEKKHDTIELVNNE